MFITSSVTTIATHGPLWTRALAVPVLVATFWFALECVTDIARRLDPALPL